MSIKKQSKKAKNPKQSADGSEKLQKVLAHLGYGSRREIEEWITQGRVSVDGNVAHVGIRVNNSQHICIDGKPAKKAEASIVPSRILLYHKPCGQVCSRTDTEGRPTVFEKLPKLKSARWVMVGRLDINTSGVLLFTTDGELAHRLMHPSYQIEREYHIRVFGKVTPEMLTTLTKGIKLDDGIAKFHNLKSLNSKSGGINQWYTATLKEGRNRLVRRLWQSQNVQVSRLMRTRFGPVELPRSLAEGEFVELEDSTKQALYKGVLSTAKQTETA